MVTDKRLFKITENNLVFKPDLTGCTTLEDVYVRLQRDYRGWLVYMGGHHVALHRASDQPRLLMVAETPANKLSDDSGSLSLPYALLGLASYMLYWMIAHGVFQALTALQGVR